MHCECCVYITNSVSLVCIHYILYIIYIIHMHVHTKVLSTLEDFLTIGEVPGKFPLSCTLHSKHQPGLVTWDSDRLIGSMSIASNIELVGLHTITR